MGKHRFWLTALTLIGAFLGGVGLPALAASYVVNTLNDNATGGDSLCTLREAIESANNAGNGDCGANSSADDTITFSVSGTITLSSPLPTIVSGQGALTINGGGNITVSGGNSVRVLAVASGAQLTLQNITIAQGNAFLGGGIFNEGTLTITNSTLSDNGTADVGGGIYNAGTVTITHSTLSGNRVNRFGGGIYNGGTMTVTNSTFSGNSASSFGGGIYNGGTMTVTNSTFSGNSAIGGGGGGIANGIGTATITNSTFSGNSARNSGGGIVNTGTMTVTNSTISGNSAVFGIGGIDNGAGTVNIKDSILANSPRGNCSNNFDRGTITASGVNFATDGSCGTGFTQKTSAELNLGSLQVNVPGTTATHALLSGSVAIDAAPDCTLVDGTTPVTEDQRGVARPQGAACDVGAYEAVVVTLTIAGAGTGSGTVTGTGISCTISIGSTSGDCSESALPGANPTVTLSATADSGSTFAGWSGHADCADGVVTINGNKVCTAQFTVVPQRTLTVAGAGTGSGTVAATGISCTITAGSTSGDCTEGYAHGTSVTLTATPNSGSTFTGWSGHADCTDGAVTMDADKTCTATFGLVNRTLTVAGAGTGSGTVAATGISCTITAGSTSGDCTEGYAHGTSVTLTATPNSGSTFTGWSGHADCTDGAVTMDADKTCTATFGLVNRTLTVAGAGTGSGTVAATGISCTITAGSTSGDCAEGYAHGTSVTLTATPNSGSTFTGWSGCDSVSGMDCQVTLTAAKLVTAQFTDPSLGCPNVLVEARPTTARFIPNLRRAYTRSFSVTVRNNSGGPVTVSDITLRPGTFDGTYTLVRISPTLPQTVLHGRSRTFTVAVRKAANTPAQTVTAPYFDVQMGCGVLPAGARLVPLRVEGLRAQIQAGQVRLEAVGEGIASLGVELFDLSGRWLLTQQGEGRELTVAVDGLANGVYLYVVRVRGFDGREYASAVRKIVILR